MHGIVDVVAELSRSVPERHSIDQLRDDLGRVRRVRAWLDGLETRVVSALDTHPSVMPAVELARSGLKASDIRRVISRTETVDTAPLLADALSSGRVTAAHVDAFTGALTIMGEHADRLVEATPTLLAQAERLSPDDFARRVRLAARTLLDDEGTSILVNQKKRTCLRTWIDDDGMTVLHGRFDPERGAVVTSLLDRAVETMFHTGHRDTTPDTILDVAPGVDPNDHRRALSLVALLQRTADPTTDPTVLTERAPRAEIIVHIDLDTLRTGLHHRSTLRTHGTGDLPATTVRRLACTADIIPVVLDGHGMPLDVGRAKRLATSHQRRALAARYPTCAVPGCHVAFHRCEPHHITPWENGGPTNLDNLVPLCTRHHHTVHEGRWTITLHPDTGEALLTPPD